jgi:hypothetical protein
MFHCKEIEPAIAAEAYERAINCSLFCSPKLLERLGYSVCYFGGFKNNQMLIVWPLIKSGPNSKKSPLFSYYFGPFWIDDKSYEPPYKMFKNNLEVLNTIFPIIDTFSEQLCFSLVPEFQDLRPFLWWNYHCSTGSKFDVKLRYSARISFENKISDNEIMYLFRGDDKRKKLKKAIRESFLTTRWGSSAQPQEYLNLYLKTIERSSRSGLDLERRQAFINMIESEDQGCTTSGIFKIIELRGVGNQKLEGFQLVLIGKNMIYLIAQSVTTEARKKNGSLLLTFEAIKYACTNGLTLDFNGANSPDRADDKHAFGAFITTYYDIELCS